MKHKYKTPETNVQQENKLNMKYPVLSLRDGESNWEDYALWSTVINSIDRCNRLGMEQKQNFCYYKDNENFIGMAF